MITTHAQRFNFNCSLSFFPDLDNRELASWRSLEVIDTLLVLAEGGHTHAVKELFAVPQAHCPGKTNHHFNNNTKYFALSITLLNLKGRVDF